MGLFMVRKCANSNAPSAAIFRALSLIIFSASIISCTKSPGGSVEELIKTAPPTFGGQLARTFSSPSTTYLLEGECDPISYAIEYSTNNQASWNEIAGGCPNKTFQITVLFSGVKKVYVRAKTKTGFTATAIATIRLLLPPTSPVLHLVNGGNADSEDGRGMQSALESMATSLSATNGVHKVQTSLVDTTYGP